MISYDTIQYHTTWYDMISYHITGYRMTAAAAAAAAAAAFVRDGDVKLFSGTLPWKNDLRKFTKMLKRSARKFCTFSLLNHYKMICFCSSYDKFCFQHKLWIFYISDIFNPECCRHLSKENLHAFLRTGLTGPALRKDEL